MARKNIFEQLSSQWNLATEVERLDMLFRRSNYVTSKYADYSLDKFVNFYCFSGWKSRGRSIDVADFLNALGYDTIIVNAKINYGDFLSLIELVFNFWKLAERRLERDNTFQHCDDFNHLFNVLLSCLSHYNHTFIYDEKKEQILVIEDNPAAITVAEIIDPDSAISVLRYNHHILRGDVEEKRKILNLMGQALEPRRKDLKNINSKSEDNIFYFLNKLHIRHNNTDEKDKKYYEEHVASMSENELEQWYDELYQMLLFAFLELDQVERNERFKTLKGLIETP